MRSYSLLRSRERSACMERVQAAIGRTLRAEYDLAQPVPERLAELLEEATQGTGRSEPEPD